MIKKTFVILGLLIPVNLICFASARSPKEDIGNLAATVNEIVSKNKTPILVSVVKTSEGYEFSDSKKALNIGGVRSSINKMHKDNPKKFIVIIVLTNEDDTSSLKELDKILSDDVTEFCLIKITK